MKKFLLIGALAVACLANAQQKVDPAFVQQLQKVQVGNQRQIVEPVAQQFDWRDASTYVQEWKALRAPKPVEYDGVDDYYVPGAFHLGLYEGMDSYAIGCIIVPLLDTVRYMNAYGPTNWSVNGNLVAENTDTYKTRYWVNGMYHVPETSDHDFEAPDGETYFLKGTMYGDGAKYQYALSAMESKWLNGENFYMTLCAMETDTMNNSSGNDLFMVGGKQSADPYQDGCGVHLDSADRAITADTLGILVPNAGLMKIEQILFPIYNAETLNDSLVLPADAVLRVALFPITENGIDFSDTIAKTEMTRADFVNAGATWGTIGTIHAKFYATDIFGATTQVPVYVDGSFYVQLTNYNESGCDFGIYEDFYCPFTGTTVYQYKGQISPRYSRGAGGKYGQNLAVTFDAYWPTLINDTTTGDAPLCPQPKEGWSMTAPVEGGWAFLGEDPENQANYLYSNVYPEDWSFDYDVDWIDFAVDTTYWGQYGVALVGFYAEELPTDVQSREATVTIDADGATQIFTILQERGAAVVTTKRDELFDNKIYNVLGIEVGEDYKGVVIRNGEKFVR